MQRLSLPNQRKNPGGKSGLMGEVRMTIRYSD